jgi:hypothetical protein
VEQEERSWGWRDEGRSSLKQLGSIFFRAWRSWDSFDTVMLLFLRLLPTSFARTKKSLSTFSQVAGLGPTPTSLSTNSYHPLFSPHLPHPPTQCSENCTPHFTFLAGNQSRRSSMSLLLPTDMVLTVNVVGRDARLSLVLIHCQVQCMCLNSEC